MLPLQSQQRWETPTYSKPADKQILDVKGGRFLIHRARPGARTFDLKFNNRFCGNYPSIEVAQAAAIKLYNEGVV
jgi:hypothetical protein